MAVLWHYSSQCCAVMLQLATLRYNARHCDIATMVTLWCCNYGDAAALQRWRCYSSWCCNTTKRQIFFSSSYLTFACCLLNVRLHSSSPCKSTAKKKKKTKDTHNGESKKTKENDCVNHFNKGIFYAHALDLNVAIGSGSTTTHGCIRFVEATSILLSNKFAQQQKTTTSAR